MNKALIFDMDGTLWDSVDNIVISWRHALDRIGESRVEVSRGRLEGLMGKTMDAFARALFSHHDEARGMELFHELETEENDYLRQNGALLLGGVEEVFARLRQLDFGIYIVSNCQSGYIEAFLDHYHLNHLVDDIACYGDTGQGKAANLRMIIEKNRLERYWYVGDTSGDHQACREAGVPFIWAAYGFGSVEAEVLRIDSLAEIVDLAQTL